VSRFFEARALDRLFITVAPLLIGDGVPGLRFDGADRLSDARRAPARRFDFGEDVCIELDLSERTVVDRPCAADENVDSSDLEHHLPTG
jgi:riboflavin biosynthesis pyrimidine reductase